MRELAESFKKAGYPETMVTEISNKVQNSARNIAKKATEEIEDGGQIIVVSTFEADKSIVNAVKSSEENLKKKTQFQNTAWPVVQICKKK